MARYQLKVAPLAPADRHSHLLICCHTGLEFSHLDKDTLHTVDSEHLEAPVVSNLPRILSQLPVPKMLLSFIAGGALA